MAQPFKSANVCRCPNFGGRCLHLSMDDSSFVTKTVHALCAVLYTHLWSGNYLPIKFYGAESGGWGLVVRHYAYEAINSPTIDVSCHE
jgi:hypothetical protein